MSQVGKGGPKAKEGRLRVFQFDRQRRERSFGSLAVGRVGGNARRSRIFPDSSLHRYVSLASVSPGTRFLGSC